MSSSYRQQALNKHGRECVECGATEAIEVHHRNGDRTDHSLDNLIPLCRRCHQKLHRSGLGGLEDELLPVEDRPQVDSTTTTFGFDYDREKWEEWKNTVPRSKSLEKRIIELIEADTDGRVIEDDEQDTPD